MEWNDRKKTNKNSKRTEFKVKTQTDIKSSNRKIIENRIHFWRAHRWIDTLGKITTWLLPTPVFSHVRLFPIFIFKISLRFFFYRWYCFRSKTVIGIVIKCITRETNERTINVNIIYKMGSFILDRVKFNHLTQTHRKFEDKRKRNENDDDNKNSLKKIRFSSNWIQYNILYPLLSFFLSLSVSLVSIVNVKYLKSFW